MQAIQDRVDDAMLLWREGRREGAFLVALVAVAARHVLTTRNLRVTKMHFFGTWSRTGSIGEA